MASPRELLPRIAIEDAATIDGSTVTAASGEPADSFVATLETATTDDMARQIQREARVSVAQGAATNDPARIGRYVVLRRLGHGGMGVVYSAYDADLDRKVAVKVVRNNLPDNSVGRARVLKEAQAMARIAHPNVVHVYEVGQDDASPGGQVFIAMEFVAGVSLSEWQRQHRATASLDAIMRLYLQAAAGLEAAHRSGLIHRDFKPDDGAMRRLLRRKSCARGLRTSCGWLGQDGAWEPGRAARIFCGGLCADAGNARGLPR